MNRAAHVKSCPVIAPVWVDAKRRRCLRARDIKRGDVSVVIADEAMIQAARVIGSIP